jgi:hypothetical protein
MIRAANLLASAKPMARASPMLNQRGREWWR